MVSIVSGRSYGRKILFRSDQCLFGALDRVNSVCGGHDC
jgi:hypothetical protein